MPQPTALLTGARGGIEGVINSLVTAQHLLEMHRRAFPAGSARTALDRFSNRLSKLLAEIRNISTA